MLASRQRDFLSLLPSLLVFFAGDGLSQPKACLEDARKPPALKTILAKHHLDVPQVGGVVRSPLIERPAWFILFLQDLCPHVVTKFETGWDVMLCFVDHFVFAVAAEDHEVSRNGEALPKVFLES